MSGPWEQFQSAPQDSPGPWSKFQPPPPTAGPWTKFAAPGTPEAPVAVPQPSLLSDEPGYTYGSVLPLRRNEKTGEVSMAFPEMIRSPVRGVQINPMEFNINDPQQVSDLQAAGSLFPGAVKSFGRPAVLPPLVEAERVGNVPPQFSRPAQPGPAAIEAPPAPAPPPSAPWLKFTREEPPVPPTAPAGPPPAADIVKFKPDEGLFAPPAAAEKDMFAPSAKPKPPASAEPKRMTPEEFHALVESTKAEAAKKEAQAKQWADDDMPLKFTKPGTDRRMLVSKDLDDPKKWRVTYFDDRGPSGHTVYDKATQAFREALDQGFNNPKPINSLKNMVK